MNRYLLPRVPVLSTAGLSRRAALGGAAALGAALGLGGRLGRTLAQEATPAAGTIKQNALAPGVAAEIFAAAPSARAAGQTVYLARFTFQPGAEIFPHSHPGTSVVGVASGTFGWTLLRGSAHVVRGSASGAAGPAEDLTAPGTEVLLEAGDAIFYEDDVVHTARGAGDGPAVVLVTQVLTAGEPRLMPAEMEMATPAP